MIYLGADHRGYNLKEQIKSWLDEWGYEFADCGAFELDENDDYPDFASVVAEKIAMHSEDGKGIVLCGSGIGMDISVNRYSFVRCGLAINIDQIRSARRDDDINVLALAVDFLDEKNIKDIIQTFLETKFSGGEKYIRRITKLSALI